MSRLISILLILALAAISSGAMSYLHALEHHHDSSAGMRAVTMQPSDDHDEDHCPLCATLHMPALAAVYMPLLVCLGLFVALLIQITPSLLAQHRAFSIDCRGPPMA